MNEMGIDNVIIVDSPDKPDSWKNIVNLKFYDIVSKEDFMEMIEENKLSKSVSGILHMGACSDTTQKERILFCLKNNYHYTKKYRSVGYQK